MTSSLKFLHSKYSEWVALRLTVLRREGSFHFFNMKTF